jgi:hypothetical protein
MNIKKIIILILFLLSTSLYTKEWNLHIGYWDGDYSSELEKRFRLDNLIDGAPDGKPRYDLNWTGGKSYIFPLGASYIKHYSNWSLVLRGNYFHRSISYNFNAVDVFSNLSVGKLNSGFSSDYEFDAGYKKGFLRNKLFLTPFLGARFHVKQFEMVERTVGSSTLYSTINGAFSSYSNHLFMGLDLQYKFREKFSVLFHANLPFFVNPSNGIFGSMKYDYNSAGMYANRTYIELNSMKSGYSYKLTRLALGLQIELHERFFLVIGFRQENTEVSYTKFENLPIRIANGGTFDNFSATPALQVLLVEQISDKIFYQNKETSTQKGLYLSGNLRFNYK